MAIVNSALSYWGRADRVFTRSQRSRLNAVLARPDSTVGGAMPVNPGIGQFWLLLPSPAARNFLETVQLVSACLIASGFRPQLSARRVMIPSSLVIGRLPIWQN
jgi:hypothetical protein